MATKPIQLTDAAFPRSRKAIRHVDSEVGLLVGAEIVPAAELIEAGYTTALDADERAAKSAFVIGPLYRSLRLSWR